MRRLRFIIRRDGQPRADVMVKFVVGVPELSTAAIEIVGDRTPIDQADDTERAIGIVRRLTRQEILTSLTECLGMEGSEFTHFHDEHSLFGDEGNYDDILDACRDRVQQLWPASRAR